MNRRFVRTGAIVGAALVSTLAVAPAFAATTVSQATAQSLQLSIAGNSAISQLITATNDGTTETKNNASTVPTLASVLPSNTLLGVGVAPQDAGANKNGTSFACAGIAGTGGGIATVGNSSCDIKGAPLTVDLANLSLGNVILGNNSALGSALNGIPGLSTLLATLGSGINQLVTTVGNGIAGTPLGAIKVGGSLSAVQGVCTATPTAATGTANIVDTSGGSNATPIGVTIPNGTGGTQTLSLLNLPANPPPNTHVLVNLDSVTQTLITALTTELNTAVGGALAPIGLGSLLQTVQDSIVTVLVQNLQPVLQPLQSNILDITLNKQSTGDAGRSIAVTALDLQVLPAAQQFTGSSLLSGAIGKVTCGPNSRNGGGSTKPPVTTPTNPSPSTPVVVDAGVSGASDHTARNVLAATTALMLLAGTAGLIGYRRMLTK